MTHPIITTLYGQDADGTWYTTPVAWVPGKPPAPPVVVPPIVIPPVVTPPAGAVVMPKVNYHYPVSATLMPPGSGGQSIMMAMVKGPVRLGVGSYTGSVTMTSGEHLYGMGGEMTDCTGLTINLPDGTTGCIIRGLFGAKIYTDGHVYGNEFDRNKWCDINVRSGLFESNRIIGHEGAINVLNAVWKNNRVIAQTRHGQADPNAYDTTIQSPAGRASINNVFLWRTFQSLPKAMSVIGQGDLTIVGLDVEQSPTIMEASDNGVIRAAVLNGGGNSNSGFTIAGDELDIIGGSFGARGPTVIDTGLKRIYTTGIHTTISGGNAPVYNDTSPPALLAPILNPVRTGSPWERPSLPVPPSSPIFTAGADATTTVQAAVNGSGLLPPGIYSISGTVTMKPGQFLFGAGDGQTIIVCKGQDAFKWSGGGTTCAFHISDLTIIGARYGVYANTAGDQLNSCTLSHITFRNCVAGLCAERIYGVDNNFFDFLNFVSCTTGILQLPDPNTPNGVETPTMTYIDKTVFYACQFIGCGKGADMQAKRADNLDAFLCCIFKDCGSVGIFSGHNALMFAGCDMLNSGVLIALLCYLIDCKLVGTTATGNAIDPAKTPQLLFGSVMA